MKKMVLFLITIFAFGQVEWESNYYKAFSRAKDENCFLMIYFTMSGVPIIKGIDRDVWSDFEIELALENKVIPVKINAMREMKITGKYQTSPPSLFFVEPNGGIVHKIEGMLDRDAVLELAEKLPESPTEYLALYERIKTAKKDQKIWGDYSDYCFEHGLYFSAYNGYKRLEKLWKKEKNDAKLVQIKTRKAICEWNLGKAKKAIKTVKKCIKKHGTDFPEYETQLFYLFSGHYNPIFPDKAIEYLEELQSKFPKSEKIVECEEHKKMIDEMFEEMKKGQDD